MLMWILRCCGLHVRQVGFLMGSGKAVRAPSGFLGISEVGRREQPPSVWVEDALGLEV